MNILIINGSHRRGNTDIAVTKLREEILKTKNTVHGMAGASSARLAIDWVQSVCIWEEAQFAGSLQFTSGARVGDIQVEVSELQSFIHNLL